MSMGKTITTALENVKLAQKFILNVATKLHVLLQIYELNFYFYLQRSQWLKQQ